MFTELLHFSMATRGRPNRRRGTGTQDTATEDYAATAVLRMPDASAAVSEDGGLNSEEEGSGRLGKHYTWPVGYLVSAFAMSTLR